MVSGHSLSASSVANKVRVGMWGIRLLAVTCNLILVRVHHAASQALRAGACGASERGAGDGALGEGAATGAPP